VVVVAAEVAAGAVAAVAVAGAAAAEVAAAALVAAEAAASGAPAAATVAGGTVAGTGTAGLAADRGERAACAKSHEKRRCDGRRIISGLPHYQTNPVLAVTSQRRRKAF
jgi:hypothetical protein